MYVIVMIKVFNNQSNRIFFKNQLHINYLSFESVPSVFWQNPEHVYHHCVLKELVKLGDLKNEKIISVFGSLTL